MADADTAPEWRMIPDFPDYEVSNDGRVRRVTPPSDGRKPPRPLPSELAQIIDPWGYPTVRMRRPGSRAVYTRTVHRLVLRAFVGEPPEGRNHGAHWNGDKTDNRLKNLRWATPKENARDALRLGELSCGPSHPGAKLTYEDIDKMKDLRDQGMTYKAIADEFDINVASAFDAINGKSYRNRPQPQPNEPG